MLNFHRTAKAPPNYLAWREQRKLLLWVLLIGVPIILAQATYNFFQNPTPPRPVAEGAKIDPRLPTVSHSITALDSFTAEKTFERNDDQLPPRDNRDKFFRGVMPEYLDSVRDDTPSRKGDQDAFFNLMQTLDRADEHELKAGSLGPITYVQLYRQPDVYRGKLVDLRGTVRRAHRLPLARNHTGLTHNYELWLFTEDSGTNPIKVYALNLPEGFPTGMKIQEPVELTGFFFKRAAYAAKGGGMTAPTVLAKTVTWKSPSPQEVAAAEETTQSRLKLLAVIASVGIVVLFFAMWQLNRAMRRPLITRAEKSSSISDINEDEVATVSEELNRLAREDT